MQPPRDPADQISPVPTAALLAENLLEAPGQLADRHVLQPSYVGRHGAVHCCSPGLLAAASSVGVRSPWDASSAVVGGASPGGSPWPVRRAVCRTRTSPRTRIAARRLSRVSFIDHLAFGGSPDIGEAHVHREPRFRDNLKAWVARWRQFARLDHFGDAAVPDDPSGEYGSHAATARLGRRAAGGRSSGRRHQSAPVRQGQDDRDARCVHPRVMYAVRACRCALGHVLGRFHRDSQMPHALWHRHTSCGASLPP